MFFKRIHNRTQTDRHTIQLEIRSVRDGVVICRGSNDTVRDSFGTIITVESLIGDWLPGFMQHRTVSLQHDMPILRGIRGKPQVGLCSRVDFNPQLEVEFRVTDPETLRLLEEGKIGGASLEFFPLPEGTRTRAAADGSSEEVYYRLSSDPEFCGISLVDKPSVPRADLLAFRADLPNWAFAVIDPRVLNGEITDPETVNRLRWFPHHDIRAPTRDVDMRAVAETLRVLNHPDSIQIPPEASLTREQIITQAAAHLSRHTQHGIGTRTQEENSMDYKKWIKFRVQQLMLEGMSEADALQKAKGEYLNQRPQQRTEVEALSVAGLELEGSQTQQTAQTQQQAQTVVEVRAQQTAATTETTQTATTQQAAQAQQTQQQTAAAPVVEVRTGVTDEQLTRVLSAMAQQPENPMAAIAAGMSFRMRSPEVTLEQILEQAISATVASQIQQRSIDTDALNRVHNMLDAHGIQRRALTIEGNGTVIRQDLARQFVIRPQASIVGRNHFRSMPMGGQQKLTVPRFDAGSLTFQWNRSSAAGAGSTTAITESDGTTDTFSIEVSELNGATRIPDSFLEFNAQGTSFVSSVVLPELRTAAQREEDKKFWLSTGSHPSPATFKGFKNQTGVTTVAASTNGDAFTINMLGSLLRALPVEYRDDPSKLAYYVPVSTGDDYGDLVQARNTAAGDAALLQNYNQPGPKPIGFYKRIPIFAVPCLPVNETQGSASNAGTIYLVHLDIPVIGDALSIRIEPYRKEGFQTIIQIQEFVGLGYQWPTGIVRRAGVLPASL